MRYKDFSLVILLYFWYLETDQPLKADRIYETTCSGVIYDVVQAVDIAIETIFAMSQKSDLNAYTWLVLKRYLYHPVEDRIINRAILLEYCKRKDRGRDQDALEILELGTSSIQFELDRFLQKCRADTYPLVNQLTLFHKG